MSSRGDRARAWAAMAHSRVFSCGCLGVAPAQYLDIRVRDGGRNNAPVGNVRISIYNAFPLPQPHPLPIAPIYQNWTDDLGDLIHRLPAGQYHIRAQKDWYAPDDEWVYNVDLPERSNRIVRFNIHRLRFYLHVDADRNGQVDDWPESIDAPAPAWAWGPDGRGAIVPVNVDNDNANLLNAGDAEDAVINGINDQNSDIARIEIRRHGGNNPVPNTWQSRLEILSPAGDPTPENNVRIFDGVAVGANAVVGPGTPHAPLAAWPAGNVPYGMEATRYAGHDFTGVVSVRLTVTRPNGFGGHTSYMSEAQVRAASWLMPNHLNRADTVYVSRILAGPGVPVNDVAASTAFVNALNPLVAGLAPAGAGLTFSEENYDDQWMQDCMEIGYSTWPGTGAGPLRMESVMRALRARALQNMPQTLRGVNFGYTYPGLGGGLNNTFNSTGNLEVTPPARATQLARGNAGPKAYPWGRIYYGRGRPLELFDTNTREFLERQVVQNPIALNTDWLAVGHVDEMMSFIPTPNGNKPWKLLIASPTRAYAILNQVNGGLNGGSGVTPVMQRGGVALQLYVDQYEGVVPGNYWERGATNAVTSVGALLGNAPSYIADPEDYPLLNPAFNGQVHNTTYLTWQELRTWNTGVVQAVINGIIAELVNEIDLDPNLDVIEVPVIFLPEEHLYDPIINAGTHPLNIPPGQPGGYIAGALTADMVNMLVINDMLIIPQAFGPATATGDEFQLYLAQQINAANNGLNVQFVDDWDLYHKQLGEVHCGTNTLRKPANMNAWLQSQDARWWEFPA